MMRATLAFVTLLALFPVGVAAQGPSGDNGLVAFGKNAIGVFQQPVHPVVGTVAPRGWLGAGLGYNTRELWETRGFASAEGLYTIRTYWSTRVNIGLQGDRYRVEAYARARDMKR